jgi:hypothetical protein
MRLGGTAKLVVSNGSRGDWMPGAGAASEGSAFIHKTTHAMAFTMPKVLWNCALMQSIYGFRRRAQCLRCGEMCEARQPGDCIPWREENREFSGKRDISPVVVKENAFEMVLRTRQTLPEKP